MKNLTILALTLSLAACGAGGETYQAIADDYAESVCGACAGGLPGAHAECVEVVTDDFCAAHDCGAAYTGTEEAIGACLDSISCSQFGPIDGYGYGTACYGALEGN